MNGFTLKNITASYDGQIVLENFTEEFRKGETVVLMGPSGCGKTTLLRLLLGLKRPDSGVLDGVDQMRCAMVFQEDRLCESLSAVQNVELVCGSVADIREHLLALGLDTVEHDKPVRALSGGQRRRVALVRAILFASDFLIMDEPFKGLDEETRAAAMAYTVRNKGDRGLILVTHDADEADYFGGRLLRMEPVLREE